MSSPARHSVARTAVAVLGASALLAALPAAPAAQQFLQLDPGFTQDLVGFAPMGLVGGVAFAPNGDVYVTQCSFVPGGDALNRFDGNSTVTAFDTEFHPYLGLVSSAAGCGIANHPDGFLYSNTFTTGLTQLDAATGAQVAGPFGLAGNTFGISVHPETHEIAYAARFDGANDGTIYIVEPPFPNPSTRVFSSALNAPGTLIDGMEFSPCGNFLFAANFTGRRLAIFSYPEGELVQQVPVPFPGQPDGIAVHVSPPFVAVNATDGRLYRFDFPLFRDQPLYGFPPAVSLLASGGFRGDLASVGPDGCWYVTQADTRFDDGTVIDDQGVVRICGGFAPTVGTSRIRLEPVDEVDFVGDTHTVTATVSSPEGGPLEGASVVFEVLFGPNAGLVGSGVTDASGRASFSYASGLEGTDSIQASFATATGKTQVSNPVQEEWISDTCTASAVALIAGQTMPVGQVSVTNSANELLVTYQTDPSAPLLAETHLAVSLFASGLPQTKKGNPRVGHFPFKADHHPPVAEHSYMIDLDALGYGPGTTVVIAAHAAMTDGESAWGEGEGFPGNNWAMHFEYTICDPTNVPGPRPLGYSTYPQGVYADPLSAGGSYVAQNFASFYPANPPFFSFLLGQFAFFGGNNIQISSAAALQQFLPADGPAGALVSSYVDPVSPDEPDGPPATEGGRLAGELAALELNLDFSLADDPPFNHAPELVLLPLTSLQIAAGPCAGLSVSQVFSDANSVLGGLPSAFGLTPDELADCAQAINESFADVDNPNPDGFLMFPF